MAEFIHQEIEKFQFYSGQILRLAILIETNLDFFISSYFCHPQYYKTIFFNDEIVLKLSFDRKIQFFELICKEEDIEKETYQPIVDAMKFVQTMRNKVAHEDSVINDFKEGMVLQRRGSPKNIKEKTKLTPELVRKVEENVQISCSEIMKVFAHLVSPNYVKKSKEILW